ncbi:MAG: carboxypeptidase M32 [Acidilobaceae archaeon]
MFEDKRVVEVLEKYRALWSIEHALSLMGWDSETYMPSEGVRGRSIASAELVLLHRRLLLDNIAPIVEKLVDSETLNLYEKAIVRVLWREVEKIRKVPERIHYELAKLRVEASKVWRNARPKGEFNVFKPYLIRIFELKREEAEHLGYYDHPYDALLDLYEEGLRDKDVKAIFSSIVPTIKRVLERVLGEGYYPRAHMLENIEYDVGELERVNREILNILGFPWSKGRLDVSAHPFTTGLSIWDVRITTRYEGRDFRRSMFAVIHEFGHALYDLQVDEKFAMTPLEGGVSLGVHESQSRFWENIIGRSLAFTNIVKPIIDKHLKFTRDLDIEEIYKYFNIVRPSLIRVDSDEVTYNLHIYLRYSLERMIVGGEIRIDDLPEIWDDMMEELLGIRPSNPSEGVMQDIHWSITAIGYFPTYTIGNLLAAQIKATLDREVGKLSQLIESSMFDSIRSFLRGKIHIYGKLYPPKDLIVKSLGEPLNPEYFNKYLEDKYVYKVT